MLIRSNLREYGGVWLEVADSQTAGYRPAAERIRSTYRRLMRWPDGTRKRDNHSRLIARRAVWDVAFGCHLAASTTFYQERPMKSGLKP